MNITNHITHHIKFARIISGLFIGTIFITAIMFFRPLFYPLIYFVAAIMLLEWYNMTRESNFYLVVGLVLISTAIGSLLLINAYDKQGWLLLTYFLLIWTVDTMAMVGGKLIGGPKLATRLSPNKTISGLITGVVSAVTVTYLLKFIPDYQLPLCLNFSPSTKWLIYGLFATCAQASDLFISFFKRKFNIKDSGTIIPGHGGMLDRFDSIILTAPVLALFLVLY